jgi:hypothetical protein
MDTIEDTRGAWDRYSRHLALYRAYAESDHEEPLSLDQHNLLVLSEDHATADNVCALILGAAASRLRLAKWEVADPKAIEAEAANDSEAVLALRRFLTQLWILNRMRRQQYDTHYAFLRDGNTAISLAWRKRRDGTGAVRLNRESWWDGELGVFVAHDIDGEELWAVKEFEQPDPANPRDTIRRRTVYYPDKIARYVQQGSGWAEFTGDGRAAVLPWVKADGSPLGIPIVHFPNGAKVTDTPYGLSDLVGLIGLQDDLNRAQFDISAASMFTGFQQYWATGVQAPGKLKTMPGGLMSTPDVGARFGVLPPGDMSKLTESHSYKRETMAVDTSTPIHVISGVWPSGDALMRADMPAIAKAERLASSSGPQWVKVGHYATEIANTFGGLNLDESLPIMAIFDAPERIDERTEIDMQRARADLWEVVSRLPRTAMIKTGLVDGDEADRIIRERMAEYALTDDFGSPDREG